MCIVWCVFGFPIGESTLWYWVMFAVKSSSFKRTHGERHRVSIFWKKQTLITTCFACQKLCIFPHSKCPWILKLSPWNVLECPWILSWQNPTNPAFIDAANVNRLLNSTVMWRSFNYNKIFLFWTFVSYQFVVLYVVSVMYLYLFSRINYSCMASPLIQLSKIHTFIGLSVITMQLLGISHPRVRKNGILE